MATKPKFTPEQNTRITRLVAEGKTTREIAKALGVPLNTMRGKLCSMKLLPAKETFWNEDRCAKIDAMSKEGRTINEIAASVNATLRAVSMKLKSMQRPCIKAERHKPDKMPAVRFEDHPDGDSDKKRGRLPQRLRTDYSLVGSAARMCLT